MVVTGTTKRHPLLLNWGRISTAMSYEPGSLECRLLIDAKQYIELALVSLNTLPQSDHIQRQLKSVHQQLEGIHDLKRTLPITTP